jgi:hypothetical protein
MARRNIEPGRPARKLAAIRKQYIALRAEAGRLRRKEQAVWRRLEKLVGRKPRHLTTILHRPGRKDRVTHSRPPGRGRSLTAVARAIGGSGLFCGCSPIRILPQPNGDVDVCILVSCSDDPATTGYRCEYYCGTLEAEPTVGIAARPGRRRKSR